MFIKMSRGMYFGRPCEKTRYTNQTVRSYLPCRREPTSCNREANSDAVTEMSLICS